MSVRSALASPRHVMIGVSLRATRTTCELGPAETLGKIDGHVIDTSACGDGMFSPRLLLEREEEKMVTRMLYGADPFRDMRRLQNELTRIAEGGTARAPEFPTVNAYANQDGAVITAELPGVKSEDLNVSVHRDAVTLSGERQTDTEEAKGYHRRERRQGRFVRTLSLPFTVDPNGVEAAMNNGVLRLELPRAEEDKPRRIEVKAR